MENIDEKIATEISAGNDRAFNELVQKYIALIRAIVNYHLSSLPMWQDDCVNDILLSIWKNIKQYDSSKNTLKNWIAAVSKYKCIDYKRKYIRECCFSEINDNDTYISQDNEMLRSELREDIESLLSSLSEKDKKLFIKRFIMDESIDNIARAENKSASWVYSRISRARNKLKKLYAKRGNS